MNDLLRSTIAASTVSASAIGATYAKDGYFFPHNVISDAEAAGLLRAGQASFHHGHIFHAPGPNTTNARRVGVAIRYIAPSMKQVSGDKLLVSQVSGEDRFGHFEHMPAPAGRLQPDDWERAERNAEMKKEILYRGVKTELVKENRRG